MHVNAAAVGVNLFDGFMHNVYLGTQIAAVVATWRYRSCGG